MDQKKTPRTEQLEELRLYDLNDLEPILGRSRRTLLRYIYDGKLPARKVGGRWGVTKADLERFMNGEMNGDL